ncbi:nitronate monooxygenase [Halobacteriovorax sp. GB3]|uniref:NAD(P)H-dependent flavin oxidoreductase n=1 Tax=Halobacteriovorax sp. GB3 TaxID=2719615 RepID=UPI00235E2C17|nr:nitronate monooxygenase [Halobacteriovorax sp. GB3]MDD0852898.1 nitronate monooxygenase [Halobacteriovorax sp. GB3]
MTSPFPNSPLCKLFDIEYPIIQAGMVWVSGAKLAAAASNAGCLGIIGAGSMKPELLEAHIKKAKSLTDKPLAVNVPLLYHLSKEQIDVSLKEGIRIFFTSAGSPKKYTQYLKDHGATVVHVTSSPELAIKCEAAGVDAVVAEGFEAGGHNGRDEITTMCLIPQVVDALSIPVIAAGGIGDGRQIAAAFCLGASAVQLGTRFALTKESSAHDNFKKKILEATSGETLLTMKDLVPVRLMKNHFFNQVQELERRCATKEEMITLLGKGRAKKGMLEGDLEEGELEIGQVSALLKDIPTCLELVENLIREYSEVKMKL